MKKYLCLIFTLLFAICIKANNLNTVENPTAGMLSRGEARINMKIFQNNGIFLGADVGLFESFQFGLAFGGEQIIGNQKPEIHRVDYKVKLRLINETISIPAFAIGVDTQGHGKYYEDQKRYDIKSKGAYFVMSKNFGFSGLIGFDAGINYTFEWVEDEIKKIDVFMGTYKTLGEMVTIFADYSLALNDRNRYKNGDPQSVEHANIFRKTNGFLNTGIQMRLTDQIFVKLLMHDLLLNRKDIHSFDRSLQIDYRWFF